MDFDVGAQYTRAQIQQLLGVPEDRRGGDWATGYARFGDELFVFVTSGRRDERVTIIQIGGMVSNLFGLQRTAQTRLSP
jgi:hypothetical protein